MTAHRKHEGMEEPPAKRAKSTPAAADALPFHPTLFATVDELRKKHAQSEPYHHAVVHQLFDPEFLHAARKEIVEDISFREKETDICKSSPCSFRMMVGSQYPCCRQGLHLASS